MIERPRRYLLFVVATLALLACGRGGQKQASTGTTDTLTERARDSILSTSRIPGARGVGAAMRAADATSAGIRGADSVAP
jgi:hypothetical protein